MRAGYLYPFGILDRTPRAQAVLRPSKNGRGMEIYAIDNTMIDPHTFSSYVQNAFPVLPWWHWIVMAVVALGGVLWSVWRKKVSNYGGVLMGLVVFYVLFLLEALVVNRLGRPISFDPALNLSDEYQRLVNGNQAFWIYLFFNVVAFIPFGFLLSEAFSARGKKRNWSITVLVTLGLSLLVESLQWILQVGFFEVTDLLLNTLGGAIGAGVALGMRALAQEVKF